MKKHTYGLPKEVMKAIKAHKGKVGIADLNLPPAALEKLQHAVHKIDEHLEKMKGSGEMSGQGMVGMGKKHKLVKSLKRFVQGKSKIKPSSVLGAISAASTIASAFPVLAPVAAPLAAVTGGLSSVAAMSGRGLSVAGTSHVSGGALRPAGSRVHYKPVKPAKKYIEFGKKNPGIITALHEDMMEGSGKGSRLAAALGLMGATAGATVLGGIEYLKRNPSKLAWLAKEVAKHQLGSGVHLAGSHTGGGLGVAGGAYPVGNLPKAPMGRVKARGSKEDVWHGRARRTAGGLTRDDLVMSGRGKVCSKKQQARGKALAAMRKARIG